MPWSMELENLLPMLSPQLKILISNNVTDEFIKPIVITDKAQQPNRFDKEWRCGDMF